MGGFGSGGWNRTGLPTTAEALRLDVNSLNKSGALNPGCHSTSSWTRAEEQIGRLVARALPPFLVEEALAPVHGVAIFGREEAWYGKRCRIRCASGGRR